MPRQPAPAWPLPAQQLVEDDLVDEYRLFLHPLLLGSGKRLFRDIGRRPRSLRLTSCTPTTTGVLMLSYAT